MTKARCRGIGGGPLTQDAGRYQRPARAINIAAKRLFRQNHKKEHSCRFGIHRSPSQGRLS